MRLEKINRIYVIMFSIILLVLLMVVSPSFIHGEQDDYSLPAASFINDGNFFVSEDDYVYAHELFPAWGEYYQNSNGLLSVFTKKGEELAWYFPIYSAYCVPFLLFLKTMGIPCEYAFRLANYTIYILLLFFCLNLKKCKPIQKSFIILALSINPILFIIKWVSSETLLFSLLCFSLLFWLEKRYYLAALFCAIAGSLQSTILIWGIVMIIEFLIKIYVEHQKEGNFFQIYFKHWKQILSYALCYVPALVSMIYFFIFTGMLSPQAGGHWVGNSAKMYVQRFMAYLFDLNLGMLPYFTVFLLIFFILEIISIVKRKEYRYSCMFIACIGIMLAYSLHVHINCGMAGIARYNVWNSAFICIAVPYFVGNIIEGKVIIKILQWAMGAGIALTSIVLFNTWKTPDSSYTYMMPVARFVLDHFPSLYNPYQLTFYNRVEHIDNDSGYIPVPIIYSDSKGFVRKILVDQASASDVAFRLTGNTDDMEWLHARLYNVVETTYISVGKKYSLRETTPIPIETIWLSGEEWNGEQYIASGISSNEYTHTWTDGDEIVFYPLHFESDLSENSYCMRLSLAGIFTGEQQIIVVVNGNEIYNEVISDRSEIRIPFSMSEDRVLDMLIRLPKAAAPNQMNDKEPLDNRQLGLALTSIVFEKKGNME